MGFFQAIGGMLCIFLLALPCAHGETEEDLTPAETAILRTFLSRRPTFRTRDTPRVIAARTDENLWLQTLREDSRQRLAKLVPELESHLAMGRAKRQEYFKNLMAKVEHEVREAGFSLDPADELLKNYRLHLARYSRQKPRPPPWAAPQAEILTRRRFAVVFNKLLKEFNEATRASSPTESVEAIPQERTEQDRPKPLNLPLHLPRERWPLEATRYYNQQIERMSETPRQGGLPVLPAAKYRNWIAWAVKFATDQRNAIWAARIDNNYWQATYLQKIRDTRYAILGDLQRSLETNFLAAAQQPGLQRLLRTTSQLQAQRLAQLETEVFGGPSRIGGEFSKAVDPKLEWLVDLDWYLHGEGAGSPRGRFYHAHVDRTLNPGVYWKRQWQKVKTAARGVVRATIFAAAATSVAVGLSVTVKSLGLTRPDIFYSSMPESLENDSLAGRAATGNARNPDRRIFEILEGSTDTLELPVVEDLEDKISEYSTTSGPTSLAIESEVSFHPIRGTYVALPRAPERFISQVTVRRNGYKLASSEFDIVKSAKGFSFIRLKKPDWVPFIFSSDVSYIVYYSPDPATKDAPPPAPPITPQELTKIRSRFSEGKMRGEVLAGLGALDGNNNLNLWHLNETIKNHGYYSFVPGSVRPSFLNSNYVHSFADFRDDKENFCPDCDVAGEMLHSMTTDIESAQHDWTFEVRPSIHLTETSRYFRQRGRHGRLYGWKKGYSEPLILDATPTRLDPRSADEVNAFMRQMEEEEIQRQQETVEHEKPLETAYLRRRFGDERETELHPGEGILPDPDLEDPMIARQVAAKMRKALLLASIVTETTERETRNKLRDEWLGQLEDSLESLRQEVEALGLQVAPYTGSPHSTAFQFGMALGEFVENGDAEPLNRLFAEVGVEASTADNPERLSAAFTALEQLIRERVTAARALRAISPRAKSMLLVADSSLEVLKLLALHPWSGRESTSRNEVRRYCHESLLELSKVAAN